MSWESLEGELNFVFVYFGAFLIGEFGLAAVGLSLTCSYLTSCGFLFVWNFWLCIPLNWYTLLYWQYHFSQKDFNLIKLLCYWFAN